MFSIVLLIQYKMMHYFNIWKKAAEIESSSKLRIDNFQSRLADVQTRSEKAQSGFKKRKQKSIQKIRNYKMQLAQLHRKKQKLEQEEAAAVSSGFCSDHHPAATSSCHAAATQQSFPFHRVLFVSVHQSFFN